MRDIYVLRWNATLGRTNPIILAADDIERCNMEMARFTAAQQSAMVIDNVNLHEDGD